jgi:hypothetical protein
MGNNSQQDFEKMKSEIKEMQEQFNLMRNAVIEIVDKWDKHVVPLIQNGALIETFELNTKPPTKASRRKP